MPIQIQVSETPNKHDQSQNSPQHIIVKTLRTENKKKILKSAKEKCQITYKGKPIRLTTDSQQEMQEG
jgi:hypothetical protein